VKEIESISSRQVRRRIGKLAENPRPAACKKLSGHEKYRIRQERYSIVYSIEDQEPAAFVVKAGHHRWIVASREQLPPIFTLIRKLQNDFLFVAIMSELDFELYTAIPDADHNRGLSFISFDMRNPLYHIENFSSDRRRGPGQFRFTVLCGYRNPAIGGAAKRDFFGVSVDSMQNSQGNPFKGALFGILLFGQTRHLTEQIGSRKAVAMFLNLHVQRSFIEHSTPLLKKSGIRSSEADLCRDPIFVKVIIPDLKSSQAV
jgi:mRNA interferase RelE/StbE